MQNVHCQYISPTKTCFIHQMFLAVCRVYWIVFPSIWAVLTLLIPGSFITSKCPILGLYLLYACQTSAYCQQCHQKKGRRIYKERQSETKISSFRELPMRGKQTGLVPLPISSLLHHLYVPPSSLNPSIHSPSYHQHHLVSILLCIHAITAQQYPCAFQYSLCHFTSALCLSSLYGQTLQWSQKKKRRMSNISIYR